CCRSHPGEPPNSRRRSFRQRRGWTCCRRGLIWKTTEGKSAIFCLLQAVHLIISAAAETRVPKLVAVAIQAHHPKIVATKIWTRFAGVCCGGRVSSQNETAVTSEIETAQGIIIAASK